MFKEIMVQFIPSILYIIITFILGLITYYVKAFLASKSNLIEYEKQQLIQKIGIDKFNQDISIAKNLIYAVEEIGRQYNWEGNIKHTKATELIAQRTGLSEDDIFNIIKATIAEFNKSKPKLSSQTNINEKS